MYSLVSDEIARLHRPNGENQNLGDENLNATVIQYVLSRLRSIGVTDIFGVPGDYSFPLNDAICQNGGVRWIGCCNELNAAYAADGYARVKGIGALCTTYGVGELSALAGIAGAYAEHVPLFHLVGMPRMTALDDRALIHHTLGNGESNLFQRMSEPVVCASAMMTPQNVAHETERLIAEALYHRRPVYMAFPADFANHQVTSWTTPVSEPASDPESLTAAADAITTALFKASSACILPGILIAREGLQSVLRALVDASDLPCATMFMDKSVLDEQHPAYAGMYDGALINGQVRELVEKSDVILMIGTLLSDINTGAFTAKLDPSKVITIAHHQVKIGSDTYQNVEMRDILALLARKLSPRPWKWLQPESLGVPSGQGTDPIDANALYPRWANFLRADDILIAETGTVSMGLSYARLPKGASFHNQTLWGSIGWATPAAFGAAVAAPDRRVILITGDGAHQMTAQEISQFARFGLRPIVFVLNNYGYLIERLLCKDASLAYNDIAPWRYSELPRALGCEGWYTARVSTCGELDEALRKAAISNNGAYIEVVTDPYAASPLALKLGESLKARNAK